MSVLETNSIPNFPEHYPNTVPRECYESYGDLAALLNVKVLRLSKTIQLCRKISFFFPSPEFVAPRGRMS